MVTAAGECWAGVAEWGTPGDETSPYRYRLAFMRDLALFVLGDRRVLFVMLNPSTATPDELDPTVRRCLCYGHSWGSGSVEVANIFALRSTDPRALYSHQDPVGPENDHAILAAAREADLVICAWGSHGKFGGRGRVVAEMLEAAGVKLCRLGMNGDGQPSHPLYLRGDVEPEAFSSADLAERLPRKTRRRSAGA